MLQWPYCNIIDINMSLRMILISIPLDSTSKMDFQLREVIVQNQSKHISALRTDSYCQWPSCQRSSGSDTQQLYALFILYNMVLTHKQSDFILNNLLFHSF